MVDFIHDSTDNQTTSLILDWNCVSKVRFVLSIIIQYLAQLSVAGRRRLRSQFQLTFQTNFLRHRVVLFLSGVLILDLHPSEIVH